MREVLTVALQAIQQDGKRLEAVAMNLANVSSTGYKRNVVTTQSFGQMVDGMVRATVTDPANAAGANPGARAGTDAAASLVSVHIDTQSGSYKATSRELDLALGGKGFFEVMTPTGPAYTRTGEFQVDARGRLLTQQGYPVMGREGEIQLPPVPIKIDRAGNVFDASPDATQSGATQRPIAQLRIVSLEAAQVRERLAGGVVMTDSPPAELTPADYEVKQGYLENSNVSSMREMVELMQTVRHVETMQKVVNGYDEMMATAIRRLGEGG